MAEVTGSTAVARFTACFTHKRGCMVCWCRVEGRWALEGASGA